MSIFYQFKKKHTANINNSSANWFPPVSIRASSKKELDPDLAALIFIGLHDGVLHQWIVNREHLDGRQYVKTFRTIFMKGMMKSFTPMMEAENKDQSTKTK